MAGRLGFVCWASTVSRLAGESWSVDKAPAEREHLLTVRLRVGPTCTALRVQFWGAPAAFRYAAIPPRSWGRDVHLLYQSLRRPVGSRRRALPPRTITVTLTRLRAGTYLCSPLGTSKRISDDALRFFFASVAATVDTNPTRGTQVSTRAFEGNLNSSVPSVVLAGLARPRPPRADPRPPTAGGRMRSFSTQLVA